MSARAGKGQHRLVIQFTDGEALRHFARTALDSSLAIYQADTLDVEFKGNPGRNAWVVRPTDTNSKSDGQRLDLNA